MQRISLGALIIALGLLVDDAIIAVEMMMVKMEQGFDRIKAATFAWESTAFPMLTGTLITAAGFMPVGFANSSTGEYTGSMFWVLVIALIASWFVAVIFTPYLGVKLLPDFGKLHPHHDPDEIYRTPSIRETAAGDRLERRPSRRGRRDDCGRFRAGGARLHRMCRSSSSRCRSGRNCSSSCACRRAPSIGASLEAAKQAEALLKDDRDAAYYTSYVGQGPPRFWLGMNPALPDEAYSEIVIVAKDIEARERLKKKLDGALAAGAVAQARARVDRFNFGPPVGFPVQFRVIGDDPMKVREIAYKVRDVMRADDAVVDPISTGTSRCPACELVIDQDRARLLGLTPQDVATRLRMLISGVTVTTLRDGIDQVDVVARAVAERTRRPRPPWRHGDLFERRPADSRSRRSPRSTTSTKSRFSGGATAT